GAKRPPPLPSSVGQPTGARSLRDIVDARLWWAAPASELDHARMPATPYASDVSDSLEELPEPASADDEIPDAADPREWWHEPATAGRLSPHAPRQVARVQRYPER